jgi:hypothetical protein
LGDLLLGDLSLGDLSAGELPLYQYKATKNQELKVLLQGTFTISHTGFEPVKLILPSTLQPCGAIFPNMKMKIPSFFIQTYNAVPCF